MIQTQSKDFLFTDHIYGSLPSGVKVEITMLAYMSDCAKQVSQTCTVGSCITCMTTGTLTVNLHVNELHCKCVTIDK